MEYGGRWKPFHYTVKRTFAPVALSIYQKDNSVTCHAVSDLTEPIKSTVSYYLVSLRQQGYEYLINREQVVLEPGASK